MSYRFQELDSNNPEEDQYVHSPVSSSRLEFHSPLISPANLLLTLPNEQSTDQPITLYHFTPLSHDFYSPSRRPTLLLTIATECTKYCAVWPRLCGSIFDNNISFQIKINNLIQISKSFLPRIKTVVATIYTMGAFQTQSRVSRSLTCRNRR
jgi:hypothetical protein